VHKLGLSAAFVSLLAGSGCDSQPPSVQVLGPPGGTGSAEDGAATSSAGARATPAAAPGTFELDWEDGFDTIDLSRWELMTHSWDGNLAQFCAENARVEAGVLKLELTTAPEDTQKPFRGVEMRSRDTLVYGRVEASTRFAAGSAFVSSML
jgi:endo-1,3-1,4-beta-glycanase ExoK